MPLYDFQCSCGARRDDEVASPDDAVDCMACGATMTRAFSAPAQPRLSGIHPSEVQEAMTSAARNAATKPNRYESFAASMRESFPNMQSRE